MSRWQRFWFGEGGRLAAGFVRIGLAASVLLTLRKIGVDDYGADLARRSAALYDPDGILMLFGGGPPPAELFSALRIVAYVSTVMLLIGFGSRLANLISCVSALCLASYQVSWSAGWPHQYNVVFVAQIAFLFAHGGHAVSLDVVLARWRKRALQRPALGYQWSVRLVCLAVSSMYFNAFLHKMVQAHGTLRWALSDNLRNHLLIRFDRYGLDRTPIADWLLQSPWHYETAALLNLVSQLAPILAFFFFRRPALRAFFGVFFVIETVALALVMDLWNLHWLPLAVVFVDWDWLAARLGRTGQSASADGSAPGRYARFCRGFLLAFVAVWGLTSFIPKLDLALKTFPFSRFGMFSTIRAKQPYGEAQSYEFYGNRIEAVGDPLEGAGRAWADGAYAYRWLQRVHDPEVLDRKLEQLEKTIAGRWKRRATEAVRVHLVIFQVPPRPEPGRLDVHKVGVIAERLRGGPLRTLRGRIADDRTHVTITPVGFDDSFEVVRLALISDDAPRPLEIEVSKADSLSELAGDYALPELAVESLLVLADVRVDGEVRRFVVARDPPIDW